MAVDLFRKTWWDTWNPAHPLSGFWRAIVITAYKSLGWMALSALAGILAVLIGVVVFVVKKGPCLLLV